MHSRVLAIEPDRDLAAQLGGLGEDAPDLVLAFLPPNDRLQDTLDAMDACWPDSLLAGCTAMSQFAAGELVHDGSLQAFWFDEPGSRAWVEVIEKAADGDGGDEQALARFLEQRPDGAFLLVDGIRYPADSLLDRLRGLPPGRLPVIAGGLASKDLDPAHFYDNDGGWVFLGRKVFPCAALLIGLHGVEMRIEVVRGWEPASPVYTVTEASGNVLHRVNDMTAVDWYRDFFAADGELPAMPESSYGFPLIIDGPDPARKGIYRTMVVFDDPPGSVAYAGDVRVGDRVRLGLGNSESIIRAAGQIELDGVDTCMLFSCAVREIVLGEAAGEAVAAAQRALRDIPFSGFFTFGEIGPSEAGRIAYYNQTGILVGLREKPA